MAMVLEPDVTGFGHIGKIGIELRSRIEGVSKVALTILSGMFRK